LIAVAGTLLSFGPVGITRAAAAGAELQQQKWTATWIAHPDAPATAAGVFHFRRTFSLPDKPARFMVRVSADNRYRLLVNGHFVAEGPARSDPMHWRYETIDLAPFLRAGRNVIAATVWNWETNGHSHS